MEDRAKDLAGESIKAIELEDARRKKRPCWCRAGARNA